MNKRLKDIYIHLIQRLSQLTDKVEYGTKPALEKLWETSLEVDVSIQDMTAHEVQKIAHYLARDLKVVSEYGVAAEEGIKSYNSIENYEKNIPTYGIYAIGVKPL